jgi:hypothetical protein
MSVDGCVTSVAAFAFTVLSRGVGGGASEQRCCTDGKYDS